MRYKDLSSGTLFQFSSTPGTRETAIKAGMTAYSLKTGDVLDIHANHQCEALRPLTGDGYRLGVVGDGGRLVIFSQANDTQVFIHDFLVIGHSMTPKSAVKPIIGKVERAEQEHELHIILDKLDDNTRRAVNLLSVLRDGLFQDFAQLKVT